MFNNYIIRNNIWQKIKESLFSILPISLIVVVLGVSLTPLGAYDIILFCICSCLLIVGMTFFNVGADLAMMPLGEVLGKNLSKSRKLWLFIVVTFVLGFAITIAEPDLSVLAGQLISVNKWLFLSVVAIGVALCLSVGIVRIIFGIKLKYVMLACYLVIFILMFFVPQNMLPICFDSGSVTTGPMSVPFILAFGMGISSISGSKNAKEESFGLIALASVGPIITVMVMSIFIGDTQVLTNMGALASEGVLSFGGLFLPLLSNILSTMLEVAIVLLPIIAIYFVMSLSIKGLSKQSIIKFFMGIAYTFVGLVIFLAGVKTGYLPVASKIGSLLAGYNSVWLLSCVCFVIGFSMVLAEPAVHILTKRVSYATDGRISKKVMMIAFCIGVALSAILTVLRCVYSINLLYFLLPIFTVILILSFFVDDIFWAIAFDGGGVTTGVMATSFLLPMIVGVCASLGVDASSGAFGTVALIAFVPIMCTLIVGVVYRINSKAHIKKEKRAKNQNTVVINFDWRGEDEN